MKVVITTTYENVDQEWLDWYLKRLAMSEVLPGSMSLTEKIQNDGFAEFSSKDPESDVVATTKYEVKP